MTKGEVFHAADWERARRLPEYRALVDVLTSGAVGGIAYAIDLAAFDDVYPDMLRESAYMKCFTRVVLSIADNTAQFNSRHSRQFTKIEYTFDNRPEIEFSAARAYGAFIAEPGWRAASLLASKVSFECRANPRIQIADLIAREGMKDLDRRLAAAVRPERKSKVALESSGKFKFVALERDYFLEERTRASELEKDGYSAAAYHEWLSQKNAQDTWDNRVRFLEFIDRRDR